MKYLSIPRLAPFVYAVLLTGGMASCKGPGPQATAKDTTHRSAQVSDTVWEIVHDSTASHNLDVIYRTPTKFQLAKGAGLPSRTYDLDGEAWFFIRDADKKPVTIHTRQLIITIQSSYARLHIDAFASSPGEQADLLEGQLKVTKSYHSSTDNEPETLHSGDMVMINKEIDLMEKETLDPAERKAVEKKFPKTAGIAPHN